DSFTLKVHPASSSTGSSNGSSRFSAMRFPASVGGRTSPRTHSRERIRSHTTTLRGRTTPALTPAPPFPPASQLPQLTPGTGIRRAGGPQSSDHDQSPGAHHSLPSLGPQR